MYSVSKGVLLLTGAIFLTSCSSIIEGRSQEIVINTNPSGASCTLLRNDIPIGTVNPTPSAILIEKTKYDIIVKCNKDGYEEATYFDKSGAAGATFGNIVLGGGIGWAIDSATGSDNKYDSPINITLPVEVADDDDAPIKHVHHHKAVETTQKAPATPTTVADSVPDAASTNLGQSAAESPAVSDNSQSDYPSGNRR